MQACYGNRGIPHPGHQQPISSVLTCLAGSSGFSSSDRTIVTHTSPIKCYISSPPLKSSLSWFSLCSLCAGVISRALRASSRNSRCRVVVTRSPGSTMPPGMAHPPPSLRWMHTNWRSGLSVSSGGDHQNHITVIL